MTMPQFVKEKSVNSRLFKLSPSSQYRGLGRGYNFTIKYIGKLLRYPLLRNYQATFCYSTMEACSYIQILISR